MRLRYDPLVGDMVLASGTSCTSYLHRPDEVLNSPRLLNLPLLLLANKQDKDTSLSVAEVREAFDAWQRARPTGRDRAASSASLSPATASAATTADPTASPTTQAIGLHSESQLLNDAQRADRMASLDVLGVSALEG
jgi:ADP-ribosylation factor related protein 1